MEPKESLATNTVSTTGTIIADAFNLKQICLKKQNEKNIVNVDWHRLSFWPQSPLSYNYNN